MMERLLCPKTFQTEPSDSNAAKLYKHWKATLENYLDNTIPPPTVTADDPAATARAAADVQKKKRYGLFNNISADIYELDSECDTYDNAIAVLDAAYIKPTNTIYNRHKLITTKQEPSKSIDAFKQELQRVAKICNFRDVTAEENKNQYIRDAFINGLSSSSIRQRLLENMGELSLDDAFNQARALEQAQSHSVAYDINGTATPVAALPPAVTPAVEEEIAATGKPSFKRKSHYRKRDRNSCWNCGGPIHQRVSCPARDHICANCSKPGHFESVCNSAPAAPTAAPLGAIGGPQFDTPTHPPHHHFPPDQPALA